jgi:hypothetical protein
MYRHDLLHQLLHQLEQQKRIQISPRYLLRDSRGVRVHSSRHSQQLEIHTQALLEQRLEVSKKQRVPLL